MKLIDRELIVIDSTSKTKDEVIHEIAQLMMDNHRARSKDSLIKDLYQREKEASTSMGLGVAIPHAQSKSVIYTSLVFIKLSQEIYWDQDKVKVVFGIFVSEENPDNVHLKILSQLARKLTNEQFRNHLFVAADKNESYQELKFLVED